jgi:ABC-type nitrate/sulfonate/bicarbonate transport system permease component
MTEMVNPENVLGALIYKMWRLVKIDFVYAILITIIIFGVIQDYAMKKIDRILFKFKYTKKWKI